MKNDEENYVGAIAVSCGCLFCRQCLVQKAALYTTESRISKERAEQENLKCSCCGIPLKNVEID